MNGVKNDTEAIATPEAKTEEPELGTLVFQAWLYSLAGCFWCVFALLGRPGVLFVKLLLGAVFFVQAADHWVKVVRTRRGQSAKQPPPVPLRLVMVALWLTMAYLLGCELPNLPGENPLSPLLYLGAASMVAASVFLWQGWRQQDRKQQDGDTKAV